MRKYSSPLLISVTDLINKKVQDKSQQCKNLIPNFLFDLLLQLGFPQTYTNKHQFESYFLFYFKVFFFFFNVFPGLPWWPSS